MKIILPDPRFLVAPQLDEGRVEGKIFLAAPIDEHDLRALSSRAFHDRREDLVGSPLKPGAGCNGDTAWPDCNFRNPRLRIRIRQQVLSSFLAGIRSGGLERLPWNHDARQVQARIGSLQHWQGHVWPDISDTALLADLSWLAPYCLGMTTTEDLKQLDIKTILQSLLSREQLLRLNRDAPTHITVPSGSRMRLHYEPGKSPVLAVRLQEMFGTCITPTVCNGMIKVTLHLLSPSNRPIQITSDLESFWQTIYAEVKKELAGRYPRHFWPDDPCRAQATTRTKKAMQQIG